MTRLIASALQHFPGVLIVFFLFARQSRRKAVYMNLSAVLSPDCHPVTTDSLIDAAVINNPQCLPRQDRPIDSASSANAKPTKHRSHHNNSTEKITGMRWGWNFYPIPTAYPYPRQTCKIISNTCIPTGLFTPRLAKVGFFLFESRPICA